MNNAKKIISSFNGPIYISTVIIFKKNISLNSFFGVLSNFRKNHILHFLHLNNSNDDNQYFIFKMKFNIHNIYDDKFKTFNYTVIDNKTKSYYNNCDRESYLNININKCTFMQKKYIEPTKQLIFTSHYGEFYHMLIIKKMFSDYGIEFINNNYVVDVPNVIEEINNNIITTDKKIISHNNKINNIIEDSTTELMQQIEDSNVELSQKIEDLNFELSQKIIDVHNELHSTIISELNHIITLQIKLEINKEKSKLNLDNIPDNIKKYINICIMEHIVNNRMNTNSLTQNY